MRSNIQTPLVSKVIDVESNEKGWLPMLLIRTKCHRLSILRQLLGRFGINDHVNNLHYVPLGMFFYNTRAIFFLCSALYVVVLWACHLSTPSERWLEKAVYLLAITWFVDAGITLILHPLLFCPSIDSWIRKNPTYDLPSIFLKYFLLDYIIVCGMLVCGRLLELDIDHFIFLLLSNILVFGAYGGTGRGQLLFMLSLPLVAFFYVVTTYPFIVEVGANHTPYIIYKMGPLVGTLIVTLLTVRSVAWIRADEHSNTGKRLRLLGEFEDMLSLGQLNLPQSVYSDKKNDKDSKFFRRRAQKVLDILCGLDTPFWYHSACLWFVEHHRDYGTVLLLGPQVNFAEDGITSKNIYIDEGSLDKEMVITSSIRFSQQRFKADALYGRFAERDSPAALIPLRGDVNHNDENTATTSVSGILCLFGKEESWPVNRQDEPFLRSLGYIISDTLQQSQNQHRFYHEAKMSALLKMDSLDDVFSSAVSIMKEALSADACMFVFRKSPQDTTMSVVAQQGFSDSISGIEYVVGVGQTGKCVVTGDPTRFDDVKQHISEFDPEFYFRLQRAYQGEIHSWMAIPIGRPDNNFGVIKVINRQQRCTWFTEEDERFGYELALRLHVIIDRLWHLEQSIVASTNASREMKNAIAAREKAEAVARQRQDDLMVMAHQISGPLAVASTYLNILKDYNLSSRVNTMIEESEALVQDAQILSNGVFAALALEAGRKPAFNYITIDAPSELESLCKRLQLTNESQLTFTYQKEKNFPTIRMDKSVFTSVMYSLIHNAIKYADPHTKVILECSNERANKQAAIKVKSIGEPILNKDREKIFNKFERGTVHAATGRHHAGVGLGLWVARELIRANGGELVVELDATIPRLSVFVVYVPV